MAYPNFKNGPKNGLCPLGVKKASNHLVTCQDKRLLSSLPLYKGSALWKHEQKGHLLF
jgi:hypothetical protein